MRAVLSALGLGLLAGCATVQTYGGVAIEQRRVMNDLQARATMAATCDISLGAYFRELSPTERAYAALVCGGVLPDEALRARLVRAEERPRLMRLPQDGSSG